VFVVSLEREENTLIFRGQQRTLIKPYYQSTLQIDYNESTI
jgi:hypothetical protein